MVFENAARRLASILDGIWKTLAVAAVIGLLGQPAAAERVLRLTLQLPITNVLGQNVSAFKEIVERESGGGIRVEIYPGAELYKDKDVPQAVASGAVEMGVAPVTWFAPQKPAAGLFGLPFLFDSNADVTTATAPGHPIRDTLDRELISTGARPLWWQPFGLTLMLGRTEAPVHPDSFKGRKVRTFSDTMQEFVRAAGGEPVAFSGSEQYDAYQRGAVDFGMTGVTSVTSRKLHEVMGHLVNTNHTAAEFVVVINETLWSGLSAAERAILTKAARAVERDLRNSYGETHRQSLDWIAANTKMKVSDLDAAQLAAWREVATPVHDSYIERAGEIGRKLLAEARKLQ